eukprot:scaffold3015_cov78-Isochrysis_galbana.AAC.3
MARHDATSAGAAGGKASPPPRDPPWRGASTQASPHPPKPPPPPAPGPLPPPPPPQPSPAVSSPAPPNLKPSL